MYEEYLMHHGVKGQKWYVRRYQNKDGSLTTAGRKRMAKLQKKQEKLNRKMGKTDPNSQIESNKKASSEESSESKNNKVEEAVAQTKAKSLYEMSDSEMQAYVNRLRLEQQYKQLMQEKYDSEHPKKKSIVDGRSIVGRIIEQSVTSVGTETGKYALGSFANKMGNALGLDRDVSAYGKQYKKGTAAKPEKEKDKDKDKDK